MTAHTYQCTRGGGGGGGGGAGKTNWYFQNMLNVLQDFDYIAANVNSYFFQKVYALNFL